MPRPRWSAASDCRCTSRTTPTSGALAEFVWGSGKGHSNVVYIKLSSGVGAGLLFAGRLHQGAGGTAGEIGHTPRSTGTAICRCGSRGCLETVASARAIAEQLGVSRGEPVSTKELLELTADGDPAASRLIGEAGREIGVALAGPRQSDQPGLRDHRRGPERRRDLITEPVLESIRRYAIASAAEEVSVVAGVLGERAELQGALALVLHARDGVLGSGPPRRSPRELPESDFKSNKERNNSGGGACD